MTIVTAGFAFSFWGWGAGAARGLKLPSYVEGLLGIFVVGFITLFLNFFIPISPFISSAITAVGAGSGILVLKKSGPKARSGYGTEFAYVGFFLLVFLAWSQASAVVYDTGLYHLPILKWKQDFATPLGVVHLHSRLATNSVWFAAAASTLLPDLGVDPAFCLNILFAAFTARLLLLASPNDGTIISFWLGGLMLLCLVLFNGPLAFVGSVSNDLPTNLLPLICVFLAVRSWEQRRYDPALPLFAVLSTTIKASGALNVLICLPPLVLLGMNAVKATLASQIWRTLAFLGGCLILWCTYGILTSGCLVYPFSGTCLYALPWSATPADVAGEMGAIKAWARSPFGHPDVVLKDWAWLPAWWASFNDLPLIRATAILGVVGALGILAKSLLRKAPFPRLILGLGVALVVPLAAWFISAPDPRFAFGYFLALGCLPAAWVFAKTAGKRLAYYAPLGILAICALTGLTKLNRAWPTQLKSATLPLAAHDGTQGKVSLMKAGGIELKQPVGTDQCWMQTPPCTPYVRKGWTGVMHGYHMIFTRVEPAI